MDNMLERIEQLELEHDRLDPELVREKNIKPGLRNPDGTGVVAGITSKGAVKGYEIDDNGRKVHTPGKLYYCGYDVENIISSVEEEQRFGFEEIAFLLLTGELPGREDLSSFSTELARRRKLPDQAKEMLKYNSQNDDQMGALHTAVSILHKFDSNPRSTCIKDVTRQCLDLIAKFPTIVAYNCHVLCSGRMESSSDIEPDEGLSTAQNFLYMLKGTVPEDSIAHIFDIALILHAEHGGGNNSTFTVRTVSSSLTDTYMAICSGIASLAGHLHGGANEAVIEMFEDIKMNVKDWSDDDEIYAYLTGLIEKKHGDKSGKIYGIGHAVYTVSDPREKIFKKKAALLAEENGRSNELLLYEKVAVLAVRAIKDKKGINACPNVDFYSGFIYDMIGIPKELFTPIFAMSRVAGWSAHRVEEIIQGKLIRPAYISSRDSLQKYIPLSHR
jgi:citrate synthase